MKEFSMEYQNGTLSPEPQEINSQMAEIGAMTEVAKALQPLGSDSRRRVLQWAADSFGASLEFKSAQKQASEVSRRDLNGSSERLTDDYSNLAELYTASAPNTDPEKALVVGYWFQRSNDDGDFDSASLNRELNHLGHRVGNITAALGSLIARRPQLVIQTRKSGSSQQARKRYRLTTEGIKQVEHMFRGEN